LRRATTGSYFRGHGGYPALERAYEHGFASQGRETGNAALAASGADDRLRRAGGRGVQFLVIRLVRLFVFAVECRP
jgi:hypothetical protein